MKKYLIFLIYISFSLMGCTTKPSQPEELNIYEETNDPLESFNRAMFETNMFLDNVILNPLATGYRAITPQFLRTGVSNFFKNLQQPAYLANAALQGEGKATIDITKRFMTNTLLGLGGLFDVASDMEIPIHDNDFGQTLAVWGWYNSDPYIVWPILGPSNPRDTFGAAFNISVSVAELSLVHEDIAQYAITGLNAIQTREANIEFLDSLKKSSTDLYATVRSISRQNRQKKIDTSINKPEGKSKSNYDFDFPTE